MLNETCQFLIPKLRLFQYTRFLLLHFSESGLRCKECGSDVSHWVVFSVLCQFCFTRLSSALVIFTVDFKQNLATSLANYCPAWYLSESPLHCIRIRGGDIEQNRLARPRPARCPLPPPTFAADMIRICIDDEVAVKTAQSEFDFASESESERVCVFAVPNQRSFILLGRSVVKFTFLCDRSKVSIHWHCR